MITIKRETDLEIQTWWFTYSEHAHRLALSRWWQETRASKRHKFRQASAWVHCTDHQRLHVPEVPADVLNEARERFLDTLKVEV